MSGRIKSRLNYAKTKLWQAKLIQAQLNWSSIMSKLNNEKQNSPWSQLNYVQLNHEKQNSGRTQCVG